MKQAISIVFSLLLSACQATQDTPLDYVARLSNVLQFELEPPQKKTYINFPNFKQDAESSDHAVLSLREFLSLRQCALHDVLARRNSQLGRVALPSQRLLNDLEILATGPQCVAILESTNQVTLAQKLDEFLTQKRLSLPSNIANAILGQSENAGFWSLSNQTNQYPETLPTTVLPAIESLIKFSQHGLHGRYQDAVQMHSEFERSLGTLRFGDGGLLLNALNHLALALNQADLVIQARLARPLCLQPRTTERARHFQNVVNAYFINKVQAQAVKLARRYQQLMPRYSALEKLLMPHSHPGYQAWRAERDQLLLEGLSASKKHATSIQKLYAQCGLTAGNRVS